MKPQWLKVQIPSIEAYSQLKSLLKGNHTICEEAKCPNWENAGKEKLLLFLSWAISAQETVNIAMSDMELLLKLTKKNRKK